MVFGMIERKPAIIVDLDGTLCDTSHRQHFMEQKPKDWKSFYEGIPGDKPNDWCLEIIKRFCGTHQILFVSGRPEDYRHETDFWLHEHLPVIDGLRSIELFMRKSGDFRSDHIIKTEIYNNFIADNWVVSFAIDDRQQVVDMWRALGLTCLQCAKGDF
jgi:FMN phosphatase YigB (HAD superfamily)